MKFLQGLTMAQEGTNLILVVIWFSCEF